MLVEVTLPDLRAEPVLASIWLADVGEQVYEGDRLLEVQVSGATFDISAPATGRLLEQRVRPRDILVPGQVVGIVNAINDEE